MHRGLIWVVISAVSSLLIIGCGSTSVTEVASPDVVRCSTSVATPIPTVPASGGSVPITVSAARECSWTASSDVSWMQVSPASGQGQLSITLTLAANTVANSRTATLTINSQHFAVPQAAAPCQYSLGTSSANVASAGGQVSVRVNATSGCTWTAASQAGWVHVGMPSGSGEQTLGLTVDANTGGSRSAQVSIAGQTFTVYQDAYVAPAPSPAPGPSPSPLPAPTPAPGPSPTPAPSPAPTPSPTCTYALSSYSKDFGAKGGGGGFKVITSDGCAWSVSSGADWINIQSTDSAVGSADVKYSVDHNQTGNDRVGTISVAGQIYTVTQKGD